MKSIKHKANAYLYLWNPKKWDWCDLQDAIYSVNNGDIYDMYWNCGNTKKIQIGDFKQGFGTHLKPRFILRSERDSKNGDANRSEEYD